MCFTVAEQFDCIDGLLASAAGAAACVSLPQSSLMVLMACGQVLLAQQHVFHYRSAVGCIDCLWASAAGAGAFAAAAGGLY